MRLFSIGRAWPSTWAFGLGCSVTDSVCFIVLFGPWAVLIGPHDRKEGK